MDQTDSVYMSSDSVEDKPHNEKMKEDYVTRDISATTYKPIGKKCPTHQEEDLIFFCVGHGNLGCSVCMFMGHHKKCKEIKYIKEVSQTIEESNEYKEFIKDLENVAEMAECVMRKINDNRFISEKRCDALLQSVSDIKTKVIRELDIMEKKMKENVEQIKTLDKAKFDIASNACRVVSREVGTMESKMEMLKASKQVNDMFIEMKPENDTVKSMRSELEHYNEDTGVSSYTIRFGKPLEDIFNPPEQLALLELLDTKTAKVTHERDVNIRMDSDWETCNIREAVMVGDQQVAVIDSNNKNVKLLDAKQNSVVSVLQVSSRSTPCGIARIASDQIAVTIPKEKKIVLLSTKNNELCLIKEVKTPMECCWIGTIGDKFVVVVDIPERLEILDKHGLVLGTVSVNKEYQKLFGEMSRIVVSSDFCKIFVSDQAKNTVTAISLWETKIQTYSSKNHSGPASMAMDQNGVLYIVATKENDVNQITSDCKKIRTPLTKSDGLKKPQALTYCKITDRMYVGMESSDVIKVFKFYT